MKNYDYNWFEKLSKEEKVNLQDDLKEVKILYDDLLQEKSSTVEKLILEENMIKELASIKKELDYLVETVNRVIDNLSNLVLYGYARHSSIRYFLRLKSLSSTLKSHHKFILECEEKIAELRTKIKGFVNKMSSDENVAKSMLTILDSVEEYLDKVKSAVDFERGIIKEK